MKNKTIDDYNYKDVDGYIASKAPELQPMLKQLRSIIHTAAPKAAEVLSYMLPCYKYQGMLVGFGTHKKGCSFYTMNPKLLPALADELDGFDYTGSTIHFNPAKKLPVALIKKIIKIRIKENEALADLKKISTHKQ